MKRILPAIILLCTFLNGFAQIINIPDPVFKAKLLSSNGIYHIENGEIVNGDADTNNDGEIDVDEASAVVYLYLSHNGPQNGNAIYSLEGIEYFTNLIRLRVANHQISGSFDATIFPNLTELNCSVNNITELTVSGLTELKSLKLYNNNLSQLDLTGLQSLETLTFNNNTVSEIDISETPLLKELTFTYNNLTSLDISPAPHLELVMCGGNHIEQLTIGDNFALEELRASQNNLTEIDLEGLVSLEILEIGMNNFEQIDVSVVPQLKELLMFDNPLTSIDLSANTSLRRVDMYQTLITTLDCSNTAVTGVKAANCPNLVSVNVKNNIACAGDPDMGLVCFSLSATPSLESICIDEGELNSLNYSGYNNDGSVTIYTGDNCDVIADVASTEVVSLQRVALFPNPVKESLKINMTGKAQGIAIFDIQGRLVKNVQIAPDNLSINVSELPAGIYIAKISSGDNVYSQKFIKD